MIQWKRKGNIRQLTCGPNIVVRAQDYNSVLASQEIDAVMNHAEWVREFWAADHPKLRDRYISWAAGVDDAYWKFTGAEKRKSILVFDKSLTEQSDLRIGTYVDFLKGKGYEVMVLTRKAKNYSHSYSLAQFRTLLHSACLLVGFTVGSETQGIAWAEAWAADVPTLIFQQRERWIHGLRAECSTAPFLSDTTGWFFKDFEDFQHRFGQWQMGNHIFSPRQWVVEHMTDEVCICDLYSKLMNLLR
jgi:hypothetical protein